MTAAAASTASSGSSQETNLPALLAAYARTEFKAPVDAVSGLVALLIEDCSTGSRPEWFSDLDRLQNAARRLSAVVDGLLDPVHAEQLLAVEDPEAYSSHLRHELRTPITSLLGYGELLAEEIGDGSKAQLGLVNDVIGAARDLLGQIDAMVAFIRGVRSGVEPVAGGAGEDDRALAEPLAAIRSVLSEPTAGRPRPVGRILVVDDNGSTRDLLTRRLERDGHSVVAEASGEEALERTDADTFDLAVLDLLMPGLSGIELLRRLKSQPDTADLPVIIISALDEVSSAVRCIEAGADDYLTKPTDPILLRARVSAALDRKFLRDRERAITEQLRVEQDRSEALLRSILPLSVITRLHNGETVIADQFSEATILFSDLVDFTSATATMSPALVLELLNGIFSALDRLAADHGLEKIKTIGDAYMVAGGLPEPRPDHAAAVAGMALEMPALVEDVSRAFGQPMRIRIGLHTGPVAAGVIGKNRFIYDVWGDTVNVASRMEHHGEPSRVHISADTRAALGPGYRVEPRDAIDVKGRGRMTTFFLQGRTEPAP